jgi:hypothetical protein
MKHELPHVLDILGTWEYLANMPDLGSGHSLPKIEDYAGILESLCKGKLDFLSKPDGSLLKTYEQHVKNHFDFQKEILTQLLKPHLR